MFSFSNPGPRLRITDSDRLEIALIVRALVTGNLTPAAHLACINQSAKWWRVRRKNTCKSSRTRGEIRGYIRTLAAHVDTFTCLDLSRWMTPQQAKSNCNVMVRDGELERVKKGTLGMRGTPAVYRQTRPTSPTPP